MKTTKLLALIIIASAFVAKNDVFAQGCFSGLVPSPPRTEIQSINPILNFSLEPAVNPCNTSAGTPLTAIGMNQSNPQYMLDILCTSSTNQDINISSTGTPANAVGYRIGGNYVLWHNGNTSNIFVGVGAGNTTAYNSCTFVGNNAGNANAVINNTALGYDAMMHNTFGARNTAIGLNALYTQSWAHGDTLYLSDNTAIGYGTLYSNQPRDTLDGNKNVALGVYALYANTFGSENMAIGTQALASNTVGNANTGIGTYTLYNNTKGHNNTATGTQSLYANDSGIYNTADGDHALANNTYGNYNSAVGWEALYHNTTGINNATVGNSAIIANISGSWNSSVGAFSLNKNNSGSYNGALGFYALQTITTGYYNTALGSFADVNPGSGGITFATALGSYAIATASYQIEIGHNQNTTTIGASGFPPSKPVTRLEIRTDQGGYPFNKGPLDTAHAYVNFGRGTGWSGLRFDDLKSTSIPGKNPGPGYLSVDTGGNVIYVDTAVGGGGGSGTGIGYCSTPCGSGSGLTSMAGSGGYNLNSHNFYFAGNGGNDTTINNVAIGNGCCYVPKAKLDVYQHSGSNKGSIGIYVENDDTAISPCPGSFAIGIESKMKTDSLISPDLPAIAGWFEATKNFNTTAYGNYAIYVPAKNIPYTAGIVSIGYNPPTCANPYIGQPGGPVCALQVATDVYINGHNFNPSDRHFKTHITPVTNAIRKIDSINAVYYYYDTVGFPQRQFSSQQQTGFVAQNVDSVFPQATGYANGYYNIDYSRMTPLLLAGIQQQQQTIDSLRTICNQFQSYASCIASLCGSGSAEKSDNSKTAFLYQNAPAAPNSALKINYYLPQGTIGAILTFFDTYGNQIKTVQLSQTGNGTLNVTPDNLSNGIYSYSLIVNGSVIDTKRMIFQK